jgi:prolycopene isomerase
MLAECGVDQKVELIRIPVLYRSVFPGLDFTMSANPEEAIHDLSARWPGEAKDIRAFFTLMEKVDKEIQSLGNLDHMSSAERAAVLVQAPFKQPNLFNCFLKTADQVLDEYFEDEELKAVLAQLWVYYGPPPSELWSVLLLAANYSYFHEGAWHIKGSSQALSNAYAARIRELGGTVKTGTLVTRILVENNRAYGVQTEDGKTYTSRYVVSNADPFQTFLTLVGEEKTPKKMVRKIRSLRPAYSLVGVYLGLDVEPSFWNCKDHEMFYNGSLDADVNFRKMMEGDYENSAAAITFYTNLGDPFYAPKGKSVLVLHAYSDYDLWPREKTAYEARKEEVGEDLIDMAEQLFPGLRDHIEVKEMITPVSLKEFTLQYKGIPYGWEFTVDQSLRLTNNTPIEGLYLASSWTNPGHGVSTAQISGYHAARMILKKEGIVQ